MKKNVIMDSLILSIDICLFVACLKLLGGVGLHKKNIYNNLIKMSYDTS